MRTTQSPATAAHNRSALLAMAAMAGAMMPSASELRQLTVRHRCPKSNKQIRARAASKAARAARKMHRKPAKARGRR